MDPIANLHKLIFNREIASPAISIKYENRNEIIWPPKAGVGYNPDPIKFYKLPINQQLKHIMTAYSVKDPEFEQSAILPAGFKNIEDYIGAISRDKFGDNFEFSAKRKRVG